MINYKFQILFILFVSNILFGETVKLKNFTAQGPCVDTLRYLSLKVTDWDFYKDAEKESVIVIENEDKTELTYKLWLQEKKSPLVIIIPGIGGHYAGVSSAALAELFFGKGFSIMVISDPFCWEFLLSASSKLTPGFTPVDAHDTYNTLEIILKDAGKKFGTNIFSEKILLGYSLGALNTLFIADIDSKENKINFDKFVALSPPVDLLYGLNKLDEFSDIWKKWPDEKIKKIKNKAVYLLSNPPESGTNSLPVNSEEAKFAIGFAFKTILKETILSIHSRKDFGILKIPFKPSSRRKLEKEIEQMSYEDYMNTFLKSSYSELFNNNFSIKELGRQASLPAIENTLLTNPKIRIIHTENDFLLTDYDREWLRNIMGDRLLFFDKGGHLGYFGNPTANEYIVAALNDTPVKNKSSKNQELPKEEIINYQNKPGDFEKLKFNSFDTIKD